MAPNTGEQTARSSEHESDVFPLYGQQERRKLLVVPSRLVNPHKTAEILSHHHAPCQHERGPPNDNDTARTPCPRGTHPLSQLHQVAVDVDADHAPRPERPHNGNREVPLVAADVQALLALEPGSPHQPQSRVAGAHESRRGSGRGGFSRSTGSGAWAVPVAGAVVACSMKRELTNGQELGRLSVFLVKATAVPRWQELYSSSTWSAFHSHLGRDLDCAIYDKSNRHLG